MVHYGHYILANQIPGWEEYVSYRFLKNQLDLVFFLAVYVDLLSFNFNKCLTNKWNNISDSVEVKFDPVYIAFFTV